MALLNNLRIVEIGKKIMHFVSKNVSEKQRDFMNNLRRLSLKKLKKREYPSKQLFIMVFDGTFIQGGLADRLKGIVSGFHYCLCNNIDFRIKHTYPFEFSDYLLPNEYDWTIKPSDKVSYHLLETKYAYFMGEPLFERLTKLLNTKKQIHCYANWDTVAELNTYYQTNYQWGELFKKLFNPASEIERQIDHYKKQIGGEYIACQFRFLALLGDFNELDKPTLAKHDQQVLIKKCLNALTELKNKYNFPILVTSDSITFTSLAAKMEDVYTLPGKPVHIDYVKDVNNHEHIKTFIDFFMLSEAKKVYNIFTKEMYQSQFSQYAAKLNNIPFERILIE